MTRENGRPGPAPWRMPAGWPIDAYCEHLRQQRFAESSVRIRRLQLAAFGRAHPDPWAVTRVDVAMYLLPLADQTARSLRAALGGFYVWAALEMLPGAGMDPTIGVRVRVPPGLPRPCPDDIWQPAESRLLASGDPADRATGVMLSLAARAGLRRAEIAGISSRDVAGDRLRVVGKGEKPRAVLLPALAPVRDYLAHAGGYAFPNGHGGHLTADVVGRRISRELPDPWTAHTLRHRFATHYYSKRRDVLEVQRLLGHASIATTQIYVQLLDTGDDAELARMLAE